MSKTHPEDIRDQIPPPPPPPPPVYTYAAFSVGTAAIVYLLYIIWKWIICGCL